MFLPEDILYEDNHLLVVNKRCGDLVQSDPKGAPGLEDELKRHIARRDGKPGEAFLGVVHRVDRPVSGAVVFAKTSKALVRLNEMMRRREITKTYWAVTENVPAEPEGTLRHFLVRDSASNRSRAVLEERPGAKLAELTYKMLARSERYVLLEIGLVTGRHHQIRVQLAAVGCAIKGDLKYGARRSNTGGGISLHSREVEFLHPVRKERLHIVAPVPAGDVLWSCFEKTVAGEASRSGKTATA